MGSERVPLAACSSTNQPALETVGSPHQGAGEASGLVLSIP